MKDFVDRQYGLTPEDRIFSITDRAIQKKMKQKTEQMKLKPIRVHDLRQSVIFCGQFNTCLSVSLPAPAFALV